jgi:hypothetical protein
MCEKYVRCGLRVDASDREKLRDFIFAAHPQPSRATAVHQDISGKLEGNSNKPSQAKPERLGNGEAAGMEGLW